LDTTPVRGLRFKELVCRLTGKIHDDVMQDFSGDTTNLCQQLLDPERSDSRATVA